MIHLPLTPDELRRRISSSNASWLNRAATEAAGDTAAGRHVSEKSLWSEIKPLLVEHQRQKCAYCERKLGTAGIEWDVEHFRPKGRVDVWQSPSKLVRRSGRANDRGYFRLAFEPHNYLVSCKPCNTNHKRNYFPIAAHKRALRSTAAEVLRREQAYLLHPLDGGDAQPETLIGFHGTLARPVATDEAGRLRAKVTIELLALNRPDLDSARAEAIWHVWNALGLEMVDQQRSIRAVRSLTGPGSPFANCARCFVELYNTRRPEADEIGQKLTAIVESYSQ
jgi:hypothetical protein